MVKLILGAKGSGKTKWLIDNANKDIKEGNGNITFADVEDEHIFSLDINVRLVNLSNFEINNLEKLYGFINGMLAMDYDLEKIYIDSVYKLIKIEKSEIKEIYHNLDKISKAQEVDIFINIDCCLSDIDDEIKGAAEEVK